MYRATKPSRSRLAVTHWIRARPADCVLGDRGSIIEVHVLTRRGRLETALLGA